MGGRGGGVLERRVGYHGPRPVSSAVGDGGGGCSIKAGGVPYSTPGVQCSGGGGGHTQVRSTHARPGTAYAAMFHSSKHQHVMVSLIGCVRLMVALPLICLAVFGGEGGGRPMKAVGVPCSTSDVQCKAEVRHARVHTVGPVQGSFRREGRPSPPPLPPKELWAMSRVHRGRSAEKRRKKMGSSVAYKTIGIFLSQNMGHEDACGWATDQCKAVDVQRYASGRR